MLGKEFEFHGSFSVSKYATKMSGSSDVLNDESPSDPELFIDD